MNNTGSTKRSPGASRQAGEHRKEPWTEQAASFVGFFIYLLILKSFFLPLFIIPTGSMAETLYGQHAMHTCPNCGTEYAVGWREPPPANWPSHVPYHPTAVTCPNCRWTEFPSFTGYPVQPPTDAQPSELLRQPLVPSAGDRIFVHGWPYAWPLSTIPALGPQRWDVVVFKVPRDGQTNYIKRLVGMPGEEIEIIDGDIYADGKITQKTAEAQRSLWFAYYNQDHPPREPALRNRYFPRWVPTHDDTAWAALETRIPMYDGVGSPRGEIEFITEPRLTDQAGQINDLYGYNQDGYPRNLGRLHMVSDTRLSAEVTFEDGQGYFELFSSKHYDRFTARLYADGRLTLEHVSLEGGMPEELWGEVSGIPTDEPVTLALSNVDYVVSVLVNGEQRIVSTDEQYSITPEAARRFAVPRKRPVLKCAAEDVRLSVRHLLIERDVHYTVDYDEYKRPPNGATGAPLQLGPDEYFMCGDNSPNSLDGRYWHADTIGPHLQDAYAAGEYTPGTVPADQMLGRAFFVYWPGFQPLNALGSAPLPNCLPDLGRVRWIH